MWLDIGVADLQDNNNYKKEKHMNIIGQKVLTFNGIRPGTVFVYSGVTYIKTTEETAVNLNSGVVTSKDDSLKMTSCAIYPRASIKLN